MNKLQNLIDICKGQKKVYIQTHNYPDPDAIASAYGLQYIFSYYNIESKICYVGISDKLNTRKIIETFDIKLYSYDELSSEMNADDYIIYVDSQKNGGNSTDLIGNEIGAIDHHPVISRYEYLYKDFRITGACASIIASYMQESNIPITTELATLLLYGIKMDTLKLTRGVTELDLQMYYFLFLHSSHELISRLEKNTLEYSDLKAFGEAINNIQLIDDIGFAPIYFDCDDSIIAAVSDFMLSINEINISIVYSYRENGIKFSVRSELSNVDSGFMIRTALNGIGTGGGHSFMAGGFIPKENISALGDNTDESIKIQFIHALENVGTIENEYKYIN